MQDPNRVSRFKTKQKESERQLDLAALQSSISEASAEQLSAQEALEKAIASKSATATSPDFKRIVSEDNINLGTYNVKDEKQALEFQSS